MLQRSVLVLCASVALHACGTASQARSTGGRGGTPERPLPSDPLQLVPGDPRAVASADLEAIRTSTLFGAFSGWARRNACLGSEPLDWLLDRTSRVVLANFESDAKDQARAGVAIFRGKYQPEDLARALRLALALLGEPALPATEQTRGHFRVLQTPRLAAARLDAASLAVGTPAELRALLEVADGRRPNWLSSGALIAELDAHRWLSAHTAAAVGDLPAQAMGGVQRGLRAIGGRRIGEGLQRGALGLLFSDSSHGATARARVLYADARNASAAAAQTGPVLNRANFLLRLMGTPLPLETLQVSHAGPRMEVALMLSEPDLLGLTERLQWLLDSDVPDCGVSASTTVPKSVPDYGAGFWLRGRGERTKSHSMHVGFARRGHGVKEQARVRNGLRNRSTSLTTAVGTPG
jgi:hypothetical protein